MEAVSKTPAEMDFTIGISTSLLCPLLTRAGFLTNLALTPQEKKNIEYGRAVARHLAQYDIGQTVVISEAACLCGEANGGTYHASARAGPHTPSSGCGASTPRRGLAEGINAKPNQDLGY